MVKHVGLFDGDLTNIRTFFNEQKNMLIPYINVDLDPILVSYQD
jgi:hypothetical protein